MAKTIQLKRWSGNPVLSPRVGSYWEGAQSRNPAAIMHEGKVHLIYTAAGDLKWDHTLYLGRAVSEDGYHFERVSDEPYVAPQPDTFEGFDAGGVEDPRIVRIDDTFYMTYMARAVPAVAFWRGKRLEPCPSDGVTWTQNFRRGGLLTSKDLKTFERLGPITSEYHFDANVMLFPEKINGRFAMLHRPSDGLPDADSKAGMSIAFSDDLKTWVDDRPLIETGEGWQEKVGGSSPPVKTDRGWLTLYHGVEFVHKGHEDEKPWCHEFFSHVGHNYRTGIMLLDLDDPAKVIARAPDFILEPQETYEKWGSVNNVVFPTGTVVMNGELFIYYGGADTVCGVATVGMQELLDYVLQYPV